jgi:glycosyltransferase involved in cell wall biosynthesis
LGAVKKALVVIPNLQLIIIGDGKERRNLAWLTKKLGMENMTWFVGEQAQLAKWFSGFNLFIPACLKAGLGDIFVLLQAMHAEVPIITMANQDFEDFIIDNKNALLSEDNDSDAFAAAIIKLQQNKNLASMLKENAKSLIATELNSEIMANNLINILENK